MEREQSQCHTGTKPIISALIVKACQIFISKAMIIIIGYFCYLFPTSATDVYGTRLALAGKSLLAASEDSNAASLVT